MPHFLVFQNSTNKGFRGTIRAGNQTQAAQIIADKLMEAGYANVRTSGDGTQINFTGHFSATWDDMHQRPYFPDKYRACNCIGNVTFNILPADAYEIDDPRAPVIPQTPDTAASIGQFGLVKPSECFNQ